jgi:hypothetical protein
MSNQVWAVLLLVFSGFMLGVFYTKSFSSGPSCVPCPEIAQNAPRTVFVEAPCPTYTQGRAIAPEPILGQSGVSYDQGEILRKMELLIQSTREIRREIDDSIRDSAMESELRMRNQQQLDRLIRGEK